MQGKVILPQSITQEEWYQNVNARIVFLHLLLTATESEIMVCTNSLAQEVGLSVSDVAKAINYLKIARLITTAHSIFTIRNYNEYVVNKNCAILPQNSNFEEFWETYGYKIGKSTALKAYNKAIGKVDHATIINGVKRYQHYINSREQDAKRYIKHPTTWLNGEHWTDEYPHASNFVPTDKGIEGHKKRMQALGLTGKERPFGIALDDF